MKVVCWHPVLTDHQSYTWEALKTAGVSSLKIYVLHQLHAERQAQGWVNRHADSLPSQMIPARGWLRFCLQQLRTNKDAVHIFGSPFERPRLMLVLLAALCLGCRVVLVSEPYSPIATGYQHDGRKLLDKFKSALRPLVYRIYGAVLRRRLAGVLSISPLAARQYRAIGITAERIFPFGYFVPRTAQSEVAPQVGGPTVVHADGKPALRLVFIGTLIARKGLDVLLDAVRQARGRGVNVALDVYGPGDAERFEFDGIGSRYCGTIPFGQAQQVMATYDLMVLPSRYDGWGVVVNEALLVGVPVICSDTVGAAAVIRQWNCGGVFVSGDAEDLAATLAALSVESTIGPAKVAARQAGDALDPVVAGQYLFAILDQINAARQVQKPQCPWYEI